MCADLHLQKLYGNQKEERYKSFADFWLFSQFVIYNKLKSLNL